MTIREAQKQQRESMKDRSFREKLSYFWEYHGIKTIGLLLAVIAVIAFIVTMVTKKDYAFTGIFFGAISQDSADSYLTDFGQSAGIDPNEYALSVQCHPDIQMDQPITQEVHSSMETFSAMVAAKSVDCFAGNLELFLYYSYLEYATDLRTVLTQEELAVLAPYLHYIDGKRIEQQETNEDGLANAYFQHPDSQKPELMGDPIPVAISLEAATNAFQESYRFGENAVIGICVCTSYPQNALAFLRHCLDGI